MAETTITGLPNATLPLTGSERVPMDQAGATKDASAQDIANLAPPTNLGWTPSTRTLSSSTGDDVVLTLFTPTAAGLVPASGGGTGTFLRADGQFVAPPGGSTDLSYDQATRVLSSSTGDDAEITLADGINPGLLSSADYLKLLSLTFGVVPVSVRNNSGATIAKGVPVYVTGSSGTLPTIAPADASVEATAAKTLGLTAASIPNNADGTVQAVGLLTGLNTATLQEGALIWLSETTGAMTTTRPVQSAHGVTLGYCIKQAAGTAGIVYIKVDNGLELEELHDVLLTAQGQVRFLRRDTDGLWKDVQIVATDISNSSASGRTVLTGTPEQGRTAIGAEQAGAAAAAQAFAIQRENHTGTQTASTISDFSAAVAALGNAVWNSLRSLVNPSAVAFLRINADNTVTARNASGMRSDLELGTTDAPQFARLGLGVAAPANLVLAVGGAVVQLRQSVVISGSTYTLDVTTSNEFITSAAIAGAVTINLSNLASIPNGYIWRGVLRFAYTSGTITWFSGNTGYAVKWDGGSAVALTASDQEAVIVEVVGGSTIIEVAAMRGRA